MAPVAVKKAEGIGVPGHFLVRVGRGDEAMLVDPFTGGHPVSRDEALRRGALAVGQPDQRDPAWLAPTDLRSLITRVLANLVNTYVAHGDDPRLPVRCAWIATGNNPTLSSEIARRTVRIRLNAKQDRPWLRDRFRHPDLRQWVSAHRHELVAAALTLVRAWIAAGKPDPTGSSSLGMFESWSRVMGGILQVAGVPGFLSNLSDFYESTDTEGEMVRSFLAAWWEQYQDKEYKYEVTMSLGPRTGPELLASYRDLLTPDALSAP